VKNKQVCVVIPIHTPTPSAYELISFQQCFAVLHKHAIKVIAPHGLQLDAYYQVTPIFETIFIDAKWQSTLLGYNKLKTSRFFYNLFVGYEFLLTYELDCFVFKDELDLWCQKAYDYIGAPWFEGFAEPAPNAKLIGVGNSGFSLRRIPKIRKVLSEIYYKNPAEYNAGRKALLKAYVKYPYRWLRNQFGENYTVQNAYHAYEDIFFSEVVPAYFTDFEVAPINEAIKFSFEVKPERLFELNNQELPMGCHAWWRYNLSFWRPIVASYGYSV
jgi:hypothetical protein